MTLEQEMTAAFAQIQQNYELIEAALRLSLDKIDSLQRQRDTLQRQLDDAEDDLVRERHGGWHECA